MFRLKFPANYQVPPHSHPGIEHITIISGTLNMGMGDVFDKTKTRALTPGSVAIMPPGRTTSCGRAKRLSVRCTALDPGVSLT